jgi:hypothetical protein
VDFGISPEFAGSGELSVLISNTAVASANIQGSATCTAIPYKFGEEWSIVTDEINTWTELSPESNTWTERTAESSTWQIRA